MKKILTALLILFGVVTFGQIHQKSVVLQGSTHAPQTGNIDISGIIYSGGLSSSGVFIAPAGTYLLPSYTFTSDLDTGMYQISAGKVGFTANGNPVFEYTATGISTGLPYKSTVSPGQAPFTVASNTKTTNLNADLLDGVEASAFGQLAVANTWTANQTFTTQLSCATSGYTGTSGTLAGTTWTDAGATWGTRQWIGATFRDADGTTTTVTNSDATTLTLTSGVDITDGAYTLTGAGNESFGNGALATHAGNYQTAFGFQALYASKGYANTGFGYMALAGNAGYSNTAIGVSCLKVNDTGYFNLAAGVEALNKNTTGHNNTALGGYDAMLANVDGNNNTCVGYGTMPAATSGEGNVMLGAGAGSLLNDTVAHDEDYNVFIGYTAGKDQTKGSNNILIGKDVQAASATGSNQLNIGNIIKGSGMDAPTTSMTTIAGNIEAASFQSRDYDLKISFTNAPAIRFSNEADSGDRAIIASNLSDSNNYTRVGGSATGLEMYSSGTIKWSADGTYSGTKDTGIKRAEAGVVLVTNGSTGLGATFTAVKIEANTAGVASPNILTDVESNKTLTNEGATALNYHTLPTAVAGYTYTFIVQDADGIQIVAGAGDTIRIAGNVSAAAGYIKNSTVGSVITLVAINATEWVATTMQGTWTIDS